jgi:hypothetical protein
MLRWLQAANLRVSEAERKASAARADAVRFERQAADGTRRHAREHAEIQSRADSLAEENTALLMDLNSRPSHKEHAALHRQIESLRAALERSQRDGYGASTASAGEAALSAAAAANAERLASRGSTSARIARDKRAAALGLSHTAALPKAVLLEAAVDACIALEVSDVTALPAAVTRLLQPAAAVPKMEAFVDTVCKAVFKDGEGFLPTQLASRDPGSVEQVQRTAVLSCFTATSLFVLWHESCFFAYLYVRYFKDALSPILLGALLVRLSATVHKAGGDQKSCYMRFQ